VKTATKKNGTKARGKRPRGVSSEFGRGCLTCLVGFLDHKSQVERWFTDHVAAFDKADAVTPEMRESFDQIIKRAGWMWANGASDHLYELEVPKRLRRKPIANKLRRFKDKWLKIGHGYSMSGGMFGGDGRPTRDEVMEGLYECERLALEVAAELDRMLGLEDARVGEWT
jgi:hypothetical protein